MKLCCSTKKDRLQGGLIVLIDFNDYCSSARINIAFIKNHSIQNKLVPPKSPSSCSLRAGPLPTVSLLHGLTETEPLPIVLTDTVIDLGAGAGQKAAGPGPSLQQSWAPLLARLLPLKDVVF